MSKTYVVTRAIVRGLFWTGVGLLGAFAIQLFILAVWSLQFQADRRVYLTYRPKWAGPVDNSVDNSCT